MIRFAHSEMFWLLLIIPVVVTVFLIYMNWRKRAIEKFGTYEVMTNLMSNISLPKIIVKFVLYSLALMFIVLALTDLQFGTKMEEVKRKGIDIVVALDVSNSMQAEDLTPSRLEHAKRSISQLIDKLHTDRLGIVVFAGRSYVQLPVTTDYSAAKVFLENISTDLVPAQGTAIGDAIETSVDCFDPESPTEKTIIVITDGENHEDDAVSYAKSANEAGIIVNAVGLGSQKGAPIPVYSEGKQIGFKKNRNEQTVISKLNEPMLAKIAEAGGGTYVRSTNATDGVRVIMEELEQMNAEEYGQTEFTDYENRFQIFLMIGLALLVLEGFISSKRYGRLKQLELFGE